MSTWQEHLNRYPTKLRLTEEELRHTSILFEEHFATNLDGKRLLFARWGTDSLYSQGVGHRWYSLDDNSVFSKEIIQRGFPNYDQIETLDPFTGTGTYQGKAIKWDKGRYCWLYLNNRTVHFNDSATSSVSSPGSPAEEEDTAKVEALLQRAETTVTTAIQKLQAPSSRPGTPSRRPGTSSIQTGSVSRTTQSTSTAQPAGSLPTPPVSKGKAPAVPRFAASAFQAPGPAPPPLPAAPPPPGPNPPNPPAAQAMAQQNQPPRPVGNPPEPYDGTPNKATPFWNTLASYYDMNRDCYTTESKCVAAALTHFKAGSQAGDWASDHMATALRNNPADYGTWDAFKDAFKEQFIPPQTQAESIGKLHNLPMGNREFNDWYQEWSMNACRANVDDVTKMYTFRRNLNQGLHQKIIAIAPQPDTLEGLVQKARELDQAWHVYNIPRSTPSRGFRPRNTRINEIKEDVATEINATQGCHGNFRGRGRGCGRLSEQERKRRFDNNLCLYCGIAGHMAAKCTAAPNRRPFPGAPMRQLGTVQEEGSTTSEIQEDPNLNAISAFNVIDAVMADPEPQAQSF